MICSDCGYYLLERDAPRPREDPLRGDEAGARSPAVCPACGSSAWAPASQTVALAPRATGVLVAPDGDRRITVAAQAFVTLGLSAGWLWVATHVARASSVVMFMVMVALAVLGMAALTIHSAHALGQARVRALPRTRWHLARPSRFARREASVGIVRATSSLLLAPLTARACVAYEIGVLVDAGGDEPIWLVREQCHAAIAIGDVSHAPDSLRLALPRERIDRERIDPLALGELLRARAIDDDPDLVFVESIVEPGASVCVQAIETPHGELSQPMPTLARLRALGA